jgi:pilus assembly protein Flp/PilA
MKSQFLKKIWTLWIWRDTSGQDMVEYALLAGFITVAVAATFPPVINELSVIFSKLGSLTSQAA